MNILSTLTLQQLIFYGFSALTLFSAFMVVSTRHPVRGVLFLVLAFVAAAGLWMLLEAEFLSLVLIFVYVGAVMTLFLFVVMMLNIEKIPPRHAKSGYFLLGLLVAAALTFLMLHGLGFAHFSVAHYPVPPPQPDDYSNIKELGAVLYTQYVLAFELASVILLVAIVAAIGIAFRGTRAGTQSQNAIKQVAARPEDRVRLVKMKPEKRQ